jgi:hypothetical protein
MLAERLRLLSDSRKADRIVLHLVELEPRATAHATFGAGAVFTAEARGVTRQAPRGPAARAGRLPRAP